LPRKRRLTAESPSAAAVAAKNVGRAYRPWHRRLAAALPAGDY